jgi:hypothetical protein
MKDGTRVQTPDGHFGIIVGPTSHSNFTYMHGGPTRMNVAVCYVLLDTGEVRLFNSRVLTEVSPGGQSHQ